MPLRDPTHAHPEHRPQRPRTTEEVKVATENVIAYVRSRKAEGWRLDSKGKPQWDYTFKDHRVALTFSKAG